MGIKNDLKILAILKRNLTIYSEEELEKFGIEGGVIEFYRDEDRNINTKMDTEDCEKVYKWLKEKDTTKDYEMLYEVLEILQKRLYFLYTEENDSIDEVCFRDLTPHEERVLQWFQLKLRKEEENE